MAKRKGRWRWLVGFCKEKRMKDGSEERELMVMWWPVVCCGVYHRHGRLCGWHWWGGFADVSGGLAMVVEGREREPNTRANWSFFSLISYL